jgi:hypothetical protein
MSTPDFSNAVRLSGRQWAGLFAFAVVLVAAAPPLWTRFERFEPGADYRIPYDLSNDYWLYERNTRLAAERFDTLLIGDSVVWGQYVTSEQTLSHALNDVTGSRRFGNLGLDGAHPVALAGLVDHYAGGVRGKTVLLQCNPLWLSSLKHDLREPEEFQFNHPRLVPQFVPEIPCYKEAVSPRIGIVVEQHVPFLSWASHLQQAYFDRQDIPSWTLEHPAENPLAPLERGLPPADDTLRHKPIPWTEQGIARQDFSWVQLDLSLQWRAFLRTVEILRGRGNRVVVLLGPFNEHMLAPRSLRQYQKLSSDMAAALRARGLTVFAPPALPSDQYGDASHPLAPGYAALARDLAPLLASEKP